MEKFTKKTLIKLVLTALVVNVLLFIQNIYFLLFQFKNCNFNFIIWLIITTLFSLYSIGSAIRNLRYLTRNP
jgi:uncharacterized membrane protein